MRLPMQLTKLMQGIKKKCPPKPETLSQMSSFFASLPIFGFNTIKIATAKMVGEKGKGKKGKMA